jgi:hypothetical protein
LSAFGIAGSAMAFLTARCALTAATAHSRKSMFLEVLSVGTNRMPTLPLKHIRSSLIAIDKGPKSRTSFQLDALDVVLANVRASIGASTVPRRPISTLERG